MELVQCEWVDPPDPPEHEPFGPKVCEKFAVDVMYDQYLCAEHLQKLKDNLDN